MTSNQTEKHLEKKDLQRMVPAKPENRLGMAL